MKDTNYKKVIIINDTSNNFHHGCDLVIYNLELLLKKYNFKIIKRIYNNSNWSHDSNFDQYLEICDLIIVNGEGTIHHNQKSGLELVKIAKYAKKYNKPSVLINCTYQNNDSIYKKYLNYFDLISVRESFSFNELKRLNIKSIIVPDLSFYLQKKIINQSIKKRKRIILSDSNYLSITNRLFNFSKKNKDYTYVPILKNGIDLITNDFLYLKKIKYFIKQSLFKILNQEPNNNDKVRYYGVRNISQYIMILKNSKFLITGRFHSVCLAIITRTPFIAIKSNSFKIESLLNDIKLNQNRLTDVDNIENNISKNYNFTNYEIQEIEDYHINSINKIECLFESIKILVDKK